MKHINIQYQYRLYMKYTSIHVITGHSKNHSWRENMILSFSELLVCDYLFVDLSFLVNTRCVFVGYTGKRIAIEIIESGFRGYGFCHVGGYPVSCPENMCLLHTEPLL